MLSILTEINQGVDTLGSVAVLLASIFGIGALVSARHRQTFLRWQEAAASAAAAVEQWRKMQRGNNMPEAKPAELEAMAMRQALQLAPDADAAKLQPLIRAAVNKLPKTHPPALDQIPGIILERVQCDPPPAKPKRPRPRNLKRTPSPEA